MPISKHSTKWVFHNKKWYSPFEWQVHSLHNGVYAHESDYYEIEEILQEERESIKEKQQMGEDINLLLVGYWEFEARVRAYLNEQIKRKVKGL